MEKVEVELLCASDDIEFKELNDELAKLDKHAIMSDLLPAVREVYANDFELTPNHSLQMYVRVRDNATLASLNISPHDTVLIVPKKRELVSRTKK